MKDERPILWRKRFLAIVIDALIITLFLWVLSALIYPLVAFTNSFAVLNYWPILAGVIMVAYFTYLEGKYGVTIGKKLMKIKVMPLEGKIAVNKTFLRNISKFLWLPLVIDLIIGLALGTRDRYLDRLSKTYVTALTDS
ncbi:MAG: RDD family protein [Methanobacteriaceae archaeon]